jgi:hypothetical protein
MSAKTLLLRGALLACAAVSLSGCLAVAATGAVVGATGAVVGTGVKATGAVVGAVIPGGGGDKED